MVAQTEKSIVVAILKYLNSLPGCYAIKTHGSKLSSGQPDIIGCIKVPKKQGWPCRCGISLALEVKRPGGAATKLQESILAKWQEAGAIAAVVFGVEDVKKILEGAGLIGNPKRP